MTMNSRTYTLADEQDGAERNGWINGFHGTTDEHQVDELATAFVSGRTHLSLADRADVTLSYRAGFRRGRTERALGN